MRLIKTTFMAATLVLGASAVSTAYAQDTMSDKAKDMAIDKGSDMAKDKAKSEMGEHTGMAADKAIDMGADMAKGKSAKDAAMGAVVGEGKSEVKSMAKDAVMGETAEDAAKHYAKDKMVHEADKAVKYDKGMMTSDSKPAAHGDVMTKAPAPAPAALPANCPTGTTAQPNGTCMVTGDFNPS